MDLPEDHEMPPMCGLQPNVDDMIYQIYSPEAFYRAINQMKNINFCTVIPDGFGTKVFYISIDELVQICAVLLFICLTWRLVEAAQSCAYRICCKK